MTTDAQAGVGKERKAVTHHANAPVGWNAWSQGCSVIKWDCDDIGVWWSYWCDLVREDAVHFVASFELENDRTRRRFLREFPSYVCETRDYAIYYTDDAELPYRIAKWYLRILICPSTWKWRTCSDEDIRSVLIRPDSCNPWLCYEGGPEPCITKQLNVSTASILFYDRALIELHTQTHAVNELITEFELTMGEYGLKCRWDTDL